METKAKISLMITPHSKTRVKVFASSAASEFHQVRFEFTVRNAGSVCLVGTFSGWHPSISPMIPLGNDQWAQEVMLPPGAYQYGMVVDGKWVADTSAEASVVRRPISPFSMLRVPGRRIAQAKGASTAEPMICPERGPTTPRPRSMKNQRKIKS